MSTDFLSEIVAHKRIAVARLRAQNDLAVWRERALQHRQRAERHRFRQALEGSSPKIKIIAEFKRRSPSRGLIRADSSPTAIAKSYEDGGAVAISVLTDEKYLGGSSADLAEVRGQTQLSILRKDFVIDPVQVYEAAVSGADAVLLIAAILNDSELAGMRAIIEDELGLDALVEAHTREELQRALDAGAKLVGVNNRDLRTFEVSLETSERLIEQIPQDILAISESGFRNAEQLERLHSLGFDGFLIGEALVQTGNPASAIRKLTSTQITARTS
jgi:indole-3-glycerol phosphate synthase